MNEKEFLQQYDITKYAKPSVTVDICIFSVFEKSSNNSRKLPHKVLRVLLIKRGRHPYLGMYALPGGFAKPGENLEQAAIRELKEETNVECNFLQQGRVFSDINRDPRGWVISCSFMALVNGEKYKVTGGDDAEKAEWFDIEFKEIETTTTYKLWKLELDDGLNRINATIKQSLSIGLQSEYPEFSIINNNGIAFDHAIIIAYSVFNLRRLIKVSDIAFELLPACFTLTELQQIYETVLDKELLAPAFRRSVANIVRDTGKYEEKVKHRPSKLYMHCRKENPV